MLTPFIDRLNAKRALTGLVLATLVAVGSYQFVPNVQNKVQQAITEVRQWTPNQVSTTSMGVRLDFWHASYLIFKESPAFGAGIAGFEEGYKKLSVGTERQLSVNPHNQYLLFMNQIGLVGVFAFLWLNYVVWRQSYRLHYFWGVWVRAIVLGYAAANFFNSMLLDSAEGIFFATTLAIAFSIFLPQYKTSPNDSGVK
jgi:O-antigen ligase